MLTIRLAKREEREALEELQRRASLALGEYNEQLEAEPDAIQLPAEQIEQGGVIVAEMNDRIAGFAAVLIEDDYAELDGLFVEPDLWRKGIGAALIDVAVHTARQQGLAMMVIDSVLAGVLRKVRLYRRGRGGNPFRTRAKDVALASNSHISSAAACPR